MFIDERFSMTRLKTSFISMYVFWANCFRFGDCFLERFLLCIL